MNGHGIGSAMAKKSEEKTNVMRVLDQKKIEYEMRSYVDTDAIAGLDVANALGEDPKCVFKTLVTVAPSKKYYVFMVPVTGELNLKKAAKAVGEKSIEMIKSKDLLPLTGYVHGGCSPIGMKKVFPTVIDESALEHEKIFFSAGKIGYQVYLSLEDLRKIVSVDTADIVE